MSRQGRQISVIRGEVVVVRDTIRGVDSMEATSK
jgi:hypothetical protein